MTILTMAIIQLGTLAGYWQSVNEVNDWIKGIDTASTPKFTKAGSIQASTPLQSAATAIGNGVSFNVSSFATVGFEVTGTFVGTIAFEVSNDQTNWYPALVSQSGSNTLGNTATTSGLYYAEVVSVSYVRARISAYTSGSITVTGVADSETRPTKIVDANIVGSLAKSVYAVTPSDTVDLAQGATVGLYVGGSGDVVCITSGGTTITFTALSSGMIHPIAATRIKATGTTATSILAVY